ncbi:MAG: glycosyltransferase [Candidatus Methanoperedens sp.]|nr:glycosyltransferase [Candidatus Methanoperedens sp.]
MSFNPFNYPLCFDKPRRLTDVNSWHEHIPFAFTIVQMQKPKIFVELGTLRGDSYCAFCQAVDVLGLDTACYAIDTWEGDEHAGFYGSEVLDELKTYNDSLYRGFSQLIQSRFEEALDYFSDGSIDLIHIDGYHTYDAVKNDFETWLPKMSLHGVVLFHDINVHEKKFGVWKFWEEVKEHYPSFEFKHGHGLGVLAVGAQVSEEVLSFLNMEEQEIVTTTKLYSYLGDKITLYHKLQSMSAQFNELTTAIQNKDGQIVAITGQLNEKDGQIAAISGQLNEKLQQINELNKHIQEKDGQISAISSQLNEKLQQINELNTIIQNKDRQIASISGQLNEKLQQINELNTIIQEKEGQIAAISGQLNEKQQQINKLNTIILEKNGQIAAISGQLNEKLQQINELNTIIQEKDGQISAISCQLNEKQQQINELNTIILEKDGKIRNLENESRIIQQSIGWKALTRYRKIINYLLPHETKRRNVYDLGLLSIRIIKNEGWKSFWRKSRQHVVEKKNNKNDYDIWIQKNEPTKEELKLISKECKNFEYKPKISIITAVWNTDERWLRRFIQSVINQSYHNWELCIAEGGSTIPHVKKVLQEYAKVDKRIKIKFLSHNKGIALNSNEAISMATGEFIAFMDHDDTLAPFTLYEVIKMLNKNPHLDFIYSDEDKIDEEDNRFNPFFKPDWSPDLLLSCGYTNHLGIYRHKILEQIGMLRERFEGSQDYDMLLRFTEVIDEKNIGHIPKILYHWRQIPGSTARDPYAKDGLVVTAAKKALKDALDRRKIDGTVSDGKWPSSYRVKRSIKGEPLVTIIIPTKDQLPFLKKCIQSINEKTTYNNYEVIVVDNNSTDIETLDYLNNLDVCVLKYNKQFNFSKINNFAANHAKGEYLLFLNNDIEVISPDWIQTMLEHAQRPEVGAVGCKLLYPDKSIQHAGVILGLSPDAVTGIAGHVFNRLHYDYNGYFGLLNTIRNYSAVTAAAMMVRTTFFKEMDGFNEDLAVCYNDVDFCLRLREKGYLIVYTPYAELYHHESVSRGHKVFAHEADYMLKRWGDNLRSDSYYNSNLSLRTYYCEVNI